VTAGRRPKSGKRIRFEAAAHLPDAKDAIAALVGTAAAIMALDILGRRRDRTARQHYAVQRNDEQQGKPNPAHGAPPRSMVALTDGQYASLRQSRDSQTGDASSHNREPPAARAQPS
jgi:hypothetical protein